MTLETATVAATATRQVLRRCPLTSAPDACLRVPVLGADHESACRHVAQPLPLRACAGRRSWASTWAALPAVVGPGTADQAAADNDRADQRQPELHHQPAALGAPAQLAVLVAPRMGALHRPTAARLDRRRDPNGRETRMGVPAPERQPTCGTVTIPQLPPAVARADEQVVPKGRLVWVGQPRPPPRAPPPARARPPGLLAACCQ
jgi:hypothetical protein